MASLSIRKLDTEIYDQLRVRAANHGVSMEEEVRQIISLVVLSPERVSDVFRKYFSAKNGCTLDLSDQHKPHVPLDLDE